MEVQHADRRRTFALLFTVFAFAAAVPAAHADAAGGVLLELPELEVIDGSFGPGFSVEPHVHDDHVDSFYILEGEAEFTLGHELVRADAGSWVAAPVGTLHGFRNVGDGELRILNIHAPNTGFAARLRTR
jgi:quercetin dioxygenase-like cupin family protein